MGENEYQYEAGTFSVTQPMKDDFTKDGFVIVRNLLNNAEVDMIKSTIVEGGMLDYSYKIPDHEGRAPTMMLWKHPGNDSTGLLARSEKVVTTAEQLLDVEELYHYHGKVILKPPVVGGSFEWHQDYGYWYVYCLKPDMMAVMIAVDECTQENGGLCLLRGSHQYGRVNHGFTGGQQGADMDRVNHLMKRCELIKTSLQPGDALFFHSNVLHYSGPNNSQKRRIAINLSYNERSNSPIAPNICPEYAKLIKVQNSAILDCKTPNDFTGKIFVKEYQYEAGTFSVTQPMKDDFTKDGFIIVRHLLNKDEVEVIKSTIVDGGMMEHSYQVPDKDGRSPVMMLWKTPGNDSTGLLGRTEKMVTTAEQLLGVEELYHYSGKVLMKPPLVGGSFEWHQDYGYWYTACLKSDMMAVMVAVDECTQENGGLCLLKGSHQYGRVDHTFTGGQQGADMGRVKRLMDRCDLIKTDLQPGDALFFHSNVLHYSGPNTSQKRRIAINISYNERSNSPVEPDICLPYNKLIKVPNSAILDCKTPNDFTGKIFVKAGDDKLVKHTLDTK